MEELKLLVGMVADLPSMALWVIAFFFAYKVIIVGSIYGTIKYVAEKIHNVLVTRKTLPPIKQEIMLEDKLRGIIITSDNTLALLIRQLHRVRGKKLGFRKSNPHENPDTNFIHERSVGWLREAINEKEAREAEEMRELANTKDKAE
jgi:hypothetical protein